MTHAIQVAPVPPLGLFVDLGTNSAVRLQTRRIQLSAEEAELLAALLHYRQGCSVENLHSALYGRLSSAPAIETFRPLVHRKIIQLRKKLNLLGAQIHSRDGGGYRLEIAPCEVTQPLRGNAKCTRH